jgi:hypothetical protein
MGERSFRRNTVGALLGGQTNLKALPGDEAYLDRVRGQELCLDELFLLLEITGSVGVPQLCRGPEGLRHGS